MVDRARASTTACGHLPVSRGIERLAQQLHMAAQKLLDDAGPHHVQVGEITGRAQQDGLQGLEYEQHLKGRVGNLCEHARSLSLFSPNLWFLATCNAETL